MLVDVGGFRAGSRLDMEGTTIINSRDALGQRVEWVIERAILREVGRALVIEVRPGIPVGEELDDDRISARFERSHRQTGRGQTAIQPTQVRGRGPASPDGIGTDPAPVWWTLGEDTGIGKADGDHAVVSAAGTIMPATIRTMAGGFTTAEKQALAFVASAPGVLARGGGNVLNEPKVGTTGAIVSRAGWAGWAVTAWLVVTKEQTLAVFAPSPVVFIGSGWIVHHPNHRVRQTMLMDMRGALGTVTRGLVHAVEKTLAIQAP